MRHYARLVRAFGISEAVVEEYEGLREIMKKFRRIGVERMGDSDFLFVESDSQDEAERTFQRLKHMYDSYAREQGISGIVLEF